MSFISSLRVSFAVKVSNMHRNTNAATRKLQIVLACGKLPLGNRVPKVNEIQETTSSAFFLYCHQRNRKYNYRPKEYTVITVII